MRIKGLHDQNEYRRYYPAARCTAHIVGFTGDRDAGRQEGIDSRSRSLAGVPGSRRVIINRRSEAVEDVTTAQAGAIWRSRSIPACPRLRELRAAVEQNKAKAGGLHTGEILALANWPT